MLQLKGYKSVFDYEKFDLNMYFEFQNSELIYLINAGAYSLPQTRWLNYYVNNIKV